MVPWWSSHGKGGSDLAINSPFSSRTSTSITSISCAFVSQSNSETEILSKLPLRIPWHSEESTSKASPSSVPLLKSVAKVISTINDQQVPETPVHSPVSSIVMVFPDIFTILVTESPSLLTNESVDESPVTGINKYSISPI